MDKIRLKYETTGRAIWMSHLDTMRTFQRAMNRAGIPIKYSEGFNPHACISILMPLSVGQASLCQLMDIRVKQDVDLKTLPAALTAVMPEGIRVTDCWEDGRKAADIKWLRVSGIWDYTTKDSELACADIEDMFKYEETIEVLRKTKRGESSINIKDYVDSLQFVSYDEGIRMQAIVSAADPVINPDLIVSAVKQHLPEWTPDGVHFTRLNLYTADGDIFR